MVELKKPSRLFTLVYPADPRDVATGNSRNSGFGDLASAVVIGSIYLAACVLINLIGTADEYALLGIPIWNPGAGLGIAIVLLFGQRMVPLLFLGPLLTTLTNPHVELAWQIEIALAALAGAIHAAAALLLKNKFRFNSFVERHDLVLLLSSTTICATVLAAGYAGLFFFSGLLSADRLGVAATRIWFAEAMGILGIVPCIPLLWNHRHAQQRKIELLSEYIAIAFGAFVAFEIFWEGLSIFYILFLPIIWMAVRGGIEDVCGGILFLQLNVFIAVRIVWPSHLNVVGFQTRILVLSVTGLVVGVLVSEARRAELQLGRHRESLARLSRLGHAGELAAAVAHEVNQPLATARTYIQLALDSMKSGTPQMSLIEESTAKAAVEVKRTGDIIERLRALIRHDQIKREPRDLRQLVSGAIKLLQPASDKSRIEIRSSFFVDARPVFVDALQIQQVLLNLVRNSIEAIEQSGKRRGTIHITARPGNGGFVEVAVNDSGPGFPEEYSADTILPLASSKENGLGVGLSLCRSIIEAHGGRVWLDTKFTGGSVHFTIPTTAQ